MERIKLQVNSHELLLSQDWTTEREQQRLGIEDRKEAGNAAKL